MMIIRTTASLAKRMKIKLGSTDQKSSTKMGDWYALDCVVARKQFIMCVSSLTRLVVVLEAAPYAQFPERICDAVTEVLKAIGVNNFSIKEERNQMYEFSLAKTDNKSILGTMNDYRYQLESWHQADRMNLNDTLAMSIYLSETPSLVLPDTWPTDAALKCFGQSPPKKSSNLLKEGNQVSKPLEILKPKLHIIR